jgi:predicted N-acetyltransferase YhbS
VRLRLARLRDRPAIEALLRREGREPDELDLVRVLRAHPRRQLAITATALIGSAETVVGFGAIDLDRPGIGVETLVTDRVVTGGLDGLLSDALVGRAEALRRTRAA